MYIKLMLTISVVGALLSGLASCHGRGARTNACPAFDSKELTDWFPYRDGEKLVFASNQHTYDTLTLKNIETSTAYEASAAGFGSPDACEAYRTFQSIETDSNTNSRLYVQLQTRAPFQSETTSLNTNITLNGNTVDLANLNKDGFRDIKINNKRTGVSRLPTVTIGNRTYTGVQTAIRDTAGDHSPGMYQIYISKGHGIVGYRDESTTWVRE